MKGNVFKALFLGFIVLFAIGCKTGSQEETGLANVGELKPGHIRINYMGTGLAEYIWIFKDFHPDALSVQTTWGDKGYPVTGLNGEYRCFDIKLAENPEILGFIVLSKDFIKLSGESDIIFEFPYKYKEIFVDSSGVYIDANKTPFSGLISASISSDTMINLHGEGLSTDASAYTVFAGGSNIPFTMSGKNIRITSGSLRDYGSVKVSFTDSNNITDTRIAIPNVSLAETWYSLSDISSLGYNSSTGIFTTWAPFAFNVSVILFADAQAVKNNTPVKSGTDVVTIPLTRQADGTWKNSASASATVAANKYYKYRIDNVTSSYDVADIWAKVASKDSKATQIVSIDDSSAKPAGWNASYTNPFGNNGTIDKSYTEAVIYEMHIRDWSKAYNGTGLFEDIADALNDPTGFAAHLNDLGITHVQILPMFEYDIAGNNDKAYNWGYNPYNWNTPESRYAKDMVDGTDAVKSMRTMIKAFHDKGIAVVMDVVYNHTAGTKDGSIYDMTVPGYFYRMDANGNYSNGSGCGNEIATNHKMVSKYVIDSLKHWMNDYHINGFRFDLMGLHETSFMKEVYRELSLIDKNVMVYGEPWQGGTSTVSDGVTLKNINSCSEDVTVNGVAGFNDIFRNAIKGGEFGGFTYGQVQGNFDDKAICIGLMGSRRTILGGFAGNEGRSINYVECHDNFTLFDKLSISYLKKKEYKGDLFAAIGSAGLAEVKAQNKLAAAYVFLAQGTPFINGGQEFLRSKKGDENSYQSNDEINAINISLKTTHADVYNVYKGLIALRKANPGDFGKYNNANATKVSDGITKYQTLNFRVYFNATSEDAGIDTYGYTRVVDVTSGVPVESTVLPSTVAKKSFVILKK